MSSNEALIPNRAMFEFRLSVPRLAEAPKLKGDLAGWPDQNKLPSLSLLEDRASPMTMWMGWTTEGLYFGVSVRGKKRPVTCSRESYWSTDALRLWIDTRDARDAHRASRYCHQFAFFPDNFDGMQIAVPRAKDNAPLHPPEKLQVAGRKRGASYDMEIGLSAEVLTGYDPAEHPHIGLCYYWKDSELPDQWLTLGGVFPYYTDPSLWATVELAS